MWNRLAPRAHQCCMQELRDGMFACVEGICAKLSWTCAAVDYARLGHWTVPWVGILSLIVHSWSVPKHATCMLSGGSAWSSSCSRSQSTSRVPHQPWTRPGGHTERWAALVSTKTPCFLLGSIPTVVEDKFHNQWCCYFGIIRKVCMQQKCFWITYCRLSTFLVTVLRLWLWFMCTSLQAAAADAHGAGIRKAGSAWMLEGGWGAVKGTDDGANDLVINTLSCFFTSLKDVCRYSMHCEVCTLWRLEEHAHVLALIAPFPILFCPLRPFCAGRPHKQPLRKPSHFNLINFLQTLSVHSATGGHF